MPSKKRTCLDCGKLCNSMAENPRCKAHAYVWNKKHENKGDAQRLFQLKKYGMDLKDFDTLWVVFCGKCGICKVEMIKPLKQKGQPPNAYTVDHCHITGNIRGLLCNACNKGIGLLKDSPILLARAAWWTTKED